MNDVVAVGVGFHHAVNAPYLAFNPPEPGEQILLELFVPLGGAMVLVSGATSLLTQFHTHTLPSIYYYTPVGYILYHSYPLCQGIGCFTTAKAGI
jgi:hypothetical protein